MDNDQKINVKIYSFSFQWNHFATHIVVLSFTIIV
jgi:hypothetical protein